MTQAVGVHRLSGAHSGCRAPAPPSCARFRAARRGRRRAGGLGALLGADDREVGDVVRLGGARPEGLLDHAPERRHRRGALLRRRERLHADLRPDARRQHGARRVLPLRRLRRNQGAAQHGRRRRLVRAAQLAGQSDPLDRARRSSGRSIVAGMGLVDAAAVPALEPGPGSASGADHDRDLDHPRRPDARALRRRRRGHRVAAQLGHIRQSPGRRASSTPRRAS